MGQTKGRGSERFPWWMAAGSRPWEGAVLLANEQMCPHSHAVCFGAGHMLNTGAMGERQAGHRHLRDMGDGAGKGLPGLPGEHLRYAIRASVLPGLQLEWWRPLQG